MKVLFLGTGAADWEPSDNTGNSEYRRLSSLLIDGTLLIDPGPCVPEAIETFGVDVKKIKYVIYTHNHCDHFDADTLNYLTENGAQLITFEDNKKKQVGNYEVMPLIGNHSIFVQHYIISDGEKRLYYGLDSSWIMYDEVQAIKAKGIDFAVIDGTIGFVDDECCLFEHNNLRMVCEMKLPLEPYIKRFCISHMAKTLHTGHNELSCVMKEHGIEVAYDGWETEV